jgi:hypothetical protein
MGSEPAVLLVFGHEAGCRGPDAARCCAGSAVTLDLPCLQRRDGHSLGSLRLVGLATSAPGWRCCGQFKGGPQRRGAEVIHSMLNATLAMPCTGADGDGDERIGAVWPHRPA